MNAMKGVPQAVTAQFEGLQKGLKTLVFETSPQAKAAGLAGVIGSILVLLVIMYCIYLIPGVRGNASWMYDIASLGFIPLPKYHGDEAPEVVAEGYGHSNKM